jgi:hypothetical protein
MIAAEPEADGGFRERIAAGIIQKSASARLVARGVAAFFPDLLLGAENADGSSQWLQMRNRKIANRQRASERRDDLRRVARLKQVTVPLAR